MIAAGSQASSAVSSTATSKRIRQLHRWISMAFTITVVANFGALALLGGAMPPWVTYASLLPLAVLVLSGLYLFALPYAAKGRRSRS